MARLIKPKITQDLSLRSKCVVYTESNNQCPNCFFDPTTNASTGRYRPGGPQSFTGRVCPVCKGKGKIVATAQLQIPANVRWGAKSPQPDMPDPEGFVPIGFARVKAEVKYYDVMSKCTYLMIDNIRCIRYDAPHKRGLQSYVIAEMLVHIDK